MLNGDLSDINQASPALEAEMSTEDTAFVQAMVDQRGATDGLQSSTELNDSYLSSIFFSSLNIAEEFSPSNSFLI